MYLEDTAIFDIPSTDPDNGGLILPKGFGAFVSKGTSLVEASSNH